MSESQNPFTLSTAVTQEVIPAGRLGRLDLHAITPPVRRRP